MKYLLITWIISTTFVATTLAQNSRVYHVGAMSAMGQDNFAPHIALDTIKNKTHLYALGPLGRMQGEITVVDGVPLNVVVDANGDAVVSANWNVESPFFVNSQVQNWQTSTINTTHESIADLQGSIEEIATKNGVSLTTPFAFKITGRFNKLTIHAVMPRSSDVPGYQAGKNQANYELADQEGELIGFYSQESQGIYTPKNSFVHIHFVSSDRTKMGHLDKISVTDTDLLVSLPAASKQTGNFKVIDTDFSKGRLNYKQEINLTDLEKFHGHLCDGLIVGALALEQAMKTLYPEQPIDRTNLRIVSKPSPCLTDVAVYLTGARYQFNTFYADTDFDGLFIVQRIDNLATVVVSLNSGVKPTAIDSLGNIAIKQELSPCDLDKLRVMEDEFSQKMLESDPNKVFTTTKISAFQWSPKTKNDFIKIDILNKNLPACK